MSSEAAPTTGKPSPLKVAMRPFRDSRNRYTVMFGEGLMSSGIEVSEMRRPFSEYPVDVDAIILHWPNEFFFRTITRQWIRSWVSLAYLSIGRRRRMKIIWVAHNVLPHVREGRPAHLLRRAFLARLDGLIFLSRTSRDLLLATFPMAAKLPYLIISHGTYPPVGTQPHAAAPVGDRPVRLAFTGMVTAYKSPDRLAELVAAMDPSVVELQISGRCKDPDLQARLEALAGANVHLDLRFQEEAELEAVVDRADAVVLPYRDIVNSGSALFALSRQRPVLAPRLGSLVELQEEVGEEWVHLYDGDLTPQIVAQFVETLRRHQPSGEIALVRQSWPHIRTKIKEFIEMVAK